MNQDLATVDGRWPRFAPEALAAGFHSVHALPMRLRGTVIGGLNLFHVEPGEMRQADVESAQALADVATIAILQHRAALEAQVLNEQLNHALNSRIVIEQAKGMVAEREGLDMEQAFSTLRNHARNHNLRLVDVARDVIAGSLAAAALDRPPLYKGDLTRPLYGDPRALMHPAGTGPHDNCRGALYIEEPPRRFRCITVTILELCRVSRALAGPTGSSRRRVSGEVVGRGGLSRTPVDDDWGQIYAHPPGSSHGCAPRMRFIAHSSRTRTGSRSGGRYGASSGATAIASEIGRAGLAFAFDVLGVQAVVSCTVRHNARSRAVMERIGMRYAGEILSRGVVEGIDGEQDDAPFAVCVLLRTDWDRSSATSPGSMSKFRAAGT